MILLDYFVEKWHSDNWVVSNGIDEYLISFEYEDNKYYVACQTCDYGDYDITPFIDFTKKDAMEITNEFLGKLIEDTSYTLYQKLFYIDNGYYHINGHKATVIVVDNYCECAVEEFYSITLAMLWLYRGYYTTGHEDLIWEND